MPELGLVAFASNFPWITLLSAVATAVGAILLLMPLARQTGWIDRPSVRKSHVGDIPLIGGWAVMLALFVVQFSGPAAGRATAGYWAGAMLLFFTSLLDDRRPIRARYRLVVQFIAAVLGISFGGEVLQDVGNLLGTGKLDAWWIVVPVSIIGSVALINAVNFTDGADGLCGGLGLICLFWFVVAISMANGVPPAAGDVPRAYAPSLIPLAAAVMGGLLGFLLFNLRLPGRSRALVFLGDSGSTLLGFTLAWFAIHVTSAFGAASVSPVACLWIMAVPLADSASCFIRRMLAGVTPMTADLKHFHHLLCRSGLTIGESVFAIHALSFLCGLVGVAGWKLRVPEYWMFAVFVLALASFVGITNLAWRRIDREQPAYAVAA
jgi:UDP-GlcNAc:undecaprenyl-phosphate GlcNAc-1-phosphate transferase